VPSESALVVAGPATTSEVAGLLGASFAACRDAPAATRALPAERSRRTSPRIHLIHARDAREAELVFGLDGVAFGAPDRAAFEVLAAIAGGMFSSRLNTRLREQAGLTYGIHAVTALYRDGGTLLFQTVVPRERAAEAVRLVLVQLDRLREAPVTAAELAAAKATLRGRLVSRFETSEATADAVGDLFAHGLPPDAYGALAARLEAVSAADVQAAARHYIDLDDAEIAVVADRPAVEDGLRGLLHGELLFFVFAPPD
jgi:zinc protease